MAISGPSEQIVLEVALKSTGSVSFRGAMDDAERSLMKLNFAASNTSKTIQNAASAISPMKGAIGSLGQGITNLLHPMTLMDAAGRVASITFGVLVRDAIRGLLHDLGELGSTAFNSVADFEQLKLSVQSMLAAEKQNSGEVDNMTLAYQASNQQAQELIKWLTKLAILSPFSEQTVRDTFQMSMALGFSSSEAKRVTAAVLDWGAATGKSQIMLERTVLAFGQIRSASRLAGQEVRQLAEVGIGVDTILARALHKTTAEILDMRLKGLIPTDQALDIVISKLEKDFGGAAERSATTLRGLSTSIADLGPILLRNFLGPINEVTGKTEGFFGALEARLKVLLNTLLDPSTIPLAQRWGRYFGTLAENMFTWGENTIISFANGMIQGAYAVLNALDYIGQLITSMLITHSPPKLLKDIGKWGAGAMNEYIKGWASADFTAFSAIATEIESYIRSGAAKDDTGLIGSLLGNRGAIAKALNELKSTGAISIATLNSIDAAARRVGGDVANYVKAWAALEIANKAVIEAQTKLNAVTKYYDDQINALNLTLAKASDAQQDLTDQTRLKSLKRIMDSVYSTPKMKAEALAETNTIMAQQQLRNLQIQKTEAVSVEQTKLDAAKAEQLAAQENYDRQKAILDLQMKQNSLLA